MVITYNARVPIASSLPSEALQQVLELLKRADTTVDTPKLKVTAFSLTNPDVITILAQSVPPETLGFSIGMSRKKLTAEEFLAAIASQSPGKDSQLQGADAISTNAFKLLVAVIDGKCEYSGMLTDSLLYDEGLSLLQVLFQFPSKSLQKSTFFTLTFEGIQWKDAPENIKGSLCLSDNKEFNRKQRFELTLSLICEDDSEKNVSLKKAVQNISLVTGIDFTKSRPNIMPSRESTNAPDPNDILIAELCFQEAVSHIITKIQEQNISIDGLPRLAMPSSLTSTEAIDSGVKGQVNYRTIIKRTMRGKFPDLKFESCDDGRIFFKKFIS